jgi:hypothetical protein
MSVRYPIFTDTPCSKAILTLTAAGLGIIDKEGKQVSLAADFSVPSSAT